MTRQLRLADLAPLAAFVGHDPDHRGDWELALWLPGTQRSWLATR